MNDLMTVPKLSLGNALVNDGLKAAMGALHALDDAGVTVTHVALRGRVPVITIDKPWPFARGGVRLMRPVGRQREVVYAARVYGVQVEWAERLPRACAAGGVA